MEATSHRIAFPLSKRQQRQLGRKVPSLNPINQTADTFVKAAFVSLYFMSGFFDASSGWAHA